MTWHGPALQGVLRQLEYQLEQACVEDEKGHLDAAMGMYSRAVEAALQDVREQAGTAQWLLNCLLPSPPLPSPPLPLLSPSSPIAEEGE